MYYPTPDSLPEDLRCELPLAAQELYRLTFNAAYAAEKCDVEQAGKIAWAAIQTRYGRRPDGSWEARATHPPRF